MAGHSCSGIEWRRLGSHTLWGTGYEVKAARIRAGGREALLARLEPIGRDGDCIHLAAIEPLAARLEELLRRDPAAALEEAAKGTGLVAAEGPLSRFAALGFLSARGGRRLVLQYRPGRVVVVMEPEAMAALVAELRRRCRGAPLLEVAERAAREARGLLGCCDGVTGVLYIIA